MSSVLLKHTNDKILSVFTNTIYMLWYYEYYVLVLVPPRKKKKKKKKNKWH